MVEQVDEKQEVKKRSDVLSFPAILKEEYRLFRPHLQKTPGLYLTLCLKDGRSLSLRYKLFESFEIDSDRQAITIKLISGQSITLKGAALFDLFEMLQRHMVAEVCEYTPVRYHELPGGAPVIRLISVS